MSHWILDLARQLAILFLVAAILGLILMLLVARRLRRIGLPPGSDLVTTLRAVPLSLAIALDLLDFGLNIFATPITWMVLTRYNLQGLRTFELIKDLIPFDGPIPLTTIAWIGVRLFGGHGTRPGHVLEADEVEPGHYTPRIGR